VQILLSSPSELYRLGREICTDLYLISISAQFYDSEIVDLAFLAIFKQIVYNSAEHLISTLARGSYESTACIFSGIIHLWLEHIDMQIQSEMVDHTRAVLPDNTHMHNGSSLPEFEVIHKTLCSREKEAIMTKIMNVDTALYHMLRFSTETAKQNVTVRLGMLSAGILALPLTAFANAEFKLSSLVNVPGKDGAPQGAKLGISVEAEPISLAAINAEASTLTFIVHSPKFKNSWNGQRLSTRLSLCSSLVFSLLGSDEWPDEGYEVTSALFRKIFVVEI
jgi:hypothetical protein